MSVCGKMSGRGDTERTYEWWWLGWQQQVPVRVEQWAPYEPAVQYHLTASYDAMCMEGRTEGLLLDLAPFTDPPSPYQVWRGNPVEVTNKKEEELLGHLAIAGYTKRLWDLPKDQMPPAARLGRVIAGFYQVHKDHAPLMQELERCLTDPRSPSSPFTEPLRRRVVLLIEVERPNFMFGGVDRFRKRRPLEAPKTAPAEENDSVPPGEAVFQWWWGDPQPGGRGHWKNYHPHVSARLEELLAKDEQFRSCAKSVPIDEVRYELQRISRDCPFDLLDRNIEGKFRAPFLPESVMTVDHALFDDPSRLTNNCFVQFQRGNPSRRRPARRIRRGEAAGLELHTGEPCAICFSDSGVLTGCEKGHVVCSGCLWFALRAMVGDSGQQEKVICGCLTSQDTTAFAALALRADSSMQEMLTKPPTNPESLKEFEMELANVRSQFQLSHDIPGDIFRRKVKDWLEMLRQKSLEHLYHACSHPGCEMGNWLLRADFDAEYRPKGKCQWACKLGHKNSVLPSQADINEMNRNILLHPECYTDRCGHDSMALRRFMLCAQCVGEGLLTFAVHESGCKQWPGGGGGHRHVFCFHCGQPWAQCGHQVQCQDPGVQQVRRADDGRGGELLEIGFVDAKQYIAWVSVGETQFAACPPTLFPNGAQVIGATRQGILRMEDKEELKKGIGEGTR